MTRWPYILIALLCIPLSGCLSSVALKGGDQSAINSDNEVDRVFRASMKKTDRAVQKVLKARKLKIKGTKEEKKVKEIFVSTEGTKVAIILEAVGRQTKVTISAKKDRFFSDLETAQAILDEVGDELTVKKSKRKPTKKKSTPPGLTS